MYSLTAARVLAATVRAVQRRGGLTTDICILM